MERIHLELVVVVAAAVLFRWCGCVVAIFIGIYAVFYSTTSKWFAECFCLFFFFLFMQENGTLYTDTDVSIIEAFAIFCGLGIHNTQMYENACKLMAKQKVALECLSYHATATPAQTIKLVQDTIQSAEDYCLYSFKFIGKLEIKLSLFTSRSNCSSNSRRNDGIFHLNVSVQLGTFWRIQLIFISSNCILVFRAIAVVFPWCTNVVFVPNDTFY